MTKKTELKLPAVPCWPAKRRAGVKEAPHESVRGNRVEGFDLMPA